MFQFLIVFLWQECLLLLGWLVSIYLLTYLKVAWLAESCDYWFSKSLVLVSFGISVPKHHTIIQLLNWDHLVIKQTKIRQQN